MDPKAIHDLLKQRFGDDLLEFQEQGISPPFLVVSPGRLPEIARFLRDEPGLSFDSLMCLSGVDYKDRFAVAYHLHSLKETHRIGVKVYLPKESPSVQTVDAVWPAANFMERETYDLYGILFEGSKDLRRILLPEDWEGHPLRKDYKYPESYHGIKV
ncbi:MAG TPA: NADH-quinone oxidoreductase subunit C [Deltaproteobacteria bacterium]|nr:NADH-quinone oxidoreductase subunit C [Deltaproteobacteria bacterium]